MFVLAQYWPGSSCDLEKPCQVEGSPTHSFMLDGLWPSRLDGSFPSHCNSSQKFDVSALQPITSQLDELWADTMSAKNAGWWSYEWNKHGPCAQPLLPDELSFFSTAVALRKRYDLLELLESAKIEPGEGALPLAIL